MAHYIFSTQPSEKSKAIAEIVSQEDYKNDTMKRFADRKFLYITPSSETAEEYKVPEGKILRPILMEQADGAPLRIFIAGFSGCGKSWITGKMMDDFYNRHKPKAKPIALFTATDKDENFGKIANKACFHRIRLDEHLYDNPMDVETELRDTLAVFDDYEQHKQPHVVEAVNDIRRNCLNVGRKAGIPVIIVRQKLLDRHKTDVILNSVHAVAMFPHGASKFQANNYLERYLGMNKKEIQKVLKLSSRWIIVQINAPSFVLYERGAFFI